MSKKLLYLLIPLFVFVLNCENPFGDDEISAGHRQMHGTITFDEETPENGAYVWLDGVKIGTFTDEQGEFSLTLPSQSTLGASGGLTGTFTLFIYVANYNLVTAQIFLKDGEFVYSEGDLDKNGRLTKTLSKLFDVHTDMSPKQANNLDTLTVTITTTITAKSNPVQIILTNANASLIGGVYRKNMDTGEITFYGLSSGTTRPYYATVDADGKSWQYWINLRRIRFDVGTYEFIPHVLPNNDQIPDALYESMGIDPFTFTTDYLQIPFIRKSEQFEMISKDINEL